jgi:glycosyltransferase involved in cell wall biosynthesis
MHDQPLISIITAVYNGESFFAETVSAVLGQNYLNWEYWIVNDGSTDSSAAIAREAVRANPDRIHYIEHHGGINRGLCASRNLALAHARGEYIAILDADDVWHSTKLSEQIAIAGLFPQAGMIYGRSEYWHSWNDNPQDTGKDHIPSLVPGDRLYEPPDLLTLTYPLGSFGAPCPSDLLVQKELLSSLGGFEESFDRVQSHFEDIALLTKLYLAAPVYVSNCCWDRYRIHSDSIWATGQRTGAADLGRRAFFEWAEYYFRFHQVTAEEIWRLWRRQTIRYRNPFVYFFIRAGRWLRRSFASR